jgi:hypothetical protein
VEKLLMGLPLVDHHELAKSKENRSFWITNSLHGGFGRRRFERLASTKTVPAAVALGRFDLRRPESAFRSTRFHGAGPGHNAILATQDAFQPGGTGKLLSGHPDAKWTAKIRGGANQGTLDVETWLDWHAI